MKSWLENHCQLKTGSAVAAQLSRCRCVQIHFTNLLASAQDRVNIWQWLSTYGTFSNYFNLGKVERTEMHHLFTLVSNVEVAERHAKTLFAELECSKRSSTALSIPSDKETLFDVKVTILFWFLLAANQTVKYEQRLRCL